MTSKPFLVLKYAWSNNLSAPVISETFSITIFIGVSWSQGVSLLPVAKSKIVDCNLRHSPCGSHGTISKSLIKVTSNMILLSTREGLAYTFYYTGREGSFWLLIPCKCWSFEHKPITQIRVAAWSCMATDDFAMHDWGYHLLPCVISDRYSISQGRAR